MEEIILRKIKKARVLKEIKKNKMGELIGYSGSNYYYLETGKTRIKMTTFFEICEVLDLNPGKVMTDAYNEFHGKGI